MEWYWYVVWYLTGLVAFVVMLVAENVTKGKPVSASDMGFMLFLALLVPSLFSLYSVLPGIPA